MEISGMQQQPQKYIKYAHPHTFSQLLFVLWLNTDLLSELQCEQSLYKVTLSLYKVRLNS